MTPSPATPLQRANNRRLGDIDQYILNIEHALQLYTDIYELRDVIERQIDYIKDDLIQIKKESTC